MCKKLEVNSKYLINNTLETDNSSNYISLNFVKVQNEETQELDLSDKMGYFLESLGICEQNREILKDTEDSISTLQFLNRLFTNKKFLYLVYKDGNTNSLLAIYSRCYNLSIRWRIYLYSIIIINKDNIFIASICIRTFLTRESFVKKDLYANIEKYIPLILRELSEFTKTLTHGFFGMFIQNINGITAYDIYFFRTLIVENIIKVCDKSDYLVKIKKSTDLHIILLLLKHLSKNNIELKQIESYIYDIAIWLCITEAIRNRPLVEKAGEDFNQITDISKQTPNHAMIAMVEKLSLGITKKFVDGFTNPSYIIKRNYFELEKILTGNTSISKTNLKQIIIVLNDLSSKIYENLYENLPEK
jgi:hypothetical protein